MSGSVTVAPVSTAKFDQMLIRLSELSRLIAKLQLLSIHLGSSVDMNRVRRDLAIFRKRTLLAIRSSRDLFVEECRRAITSTSAAEKQDLERVYSMYLSAVEYFFRLLIQISDMQTAFMDPRQLMVTGVTEVIYFKSGAFSLNKQMLIRVSMGKSAINSLERLPLDKTDKDEMKVELEEVSNILNDLHSSVNLSYWAIVPDSDRTGGGGNATQTGRSKSSLMSSDEEEIGEKRNSKKKKRDTDVENGNVIGRNIPRPLVFSIASDGMYLLRRYNGPLTNLKRFLGGRIGLSIKIAGGIGLAVLLLIIILCSTLIPSNDQGISNTDQNDINMTTAAIPMTTT